MAKVITKAESSRGCGFRKPGGFYMVVDKDTVWMECGFFPIPLPRGVKFSRAPKKMTFGEIIPKNHSCSTSKKCIGCFSMIKDDHPCILTWVGASHYKNADLFVKEAKRQGISRRVSRYFLKNVKVGKTIVFMAHQYGRAIKNEKTGLTEHQCSVFGSFVPQRIEYVVTGEESEAWLNELESRVITLVHVIKISDTINMKINEN